MKLVLKVGYSYGFDDVNVKIILETMDPQFQYVIASDLASRGIDIEGVSHERYQF